MLHSTPICLSTSPHQLIAPGPISACFFESCQVPAALCDISQQTAPFSSSQDEYLVYLKWKQFRASFILKNQLFLPCFEDESTSGTVFFLPQHKQAARPVFTATSLAAAAVWKAVQIGFWSLRACLSCLCSDFLITAEWFWSQKCRSWTCYVDTDLHLCCCLCFFLPLAQPEARFASLQVQQLLPGHAAVHAVPVHAPNHLCYCSLQAIFKLWSLQVSSDGLMKNGLSQ